MMKKKKKKMKTKKKKKKQPEVCLVDVYIDTELIDKRV